MTERTLQQIISLSNSAGCSDLVWADGESIRVRYDTLVPADETEDGVEECIVDVIAVLTPGPRSRWNLAPTRPGVVRADDLPSQILPSPEDLGATGG